MKVIGFLKIILLISSIASVNSFANELNNCPSFSEISPFTQNKYGNSSYDDSFASRSFKVLLHSKIINIDGSILDVGAGYGADSFALIQLGAKKIYVNDLDKRNLECMKKHIDSVYKIQNFKLIFIPGDIVGDLVVSRLPKNAFSLVVVKNVIHFFTYDQLIDFIKILNKIIANNGRIVISYSNSHINYLNTIVDQVFKAHKQFPRIPLDKIVESAYKKFHMSDGRQCSFNAYDSAPADMKLPGFPCEIPVDSGKGQLLLPDIFIALMNASGFELIFSNSYEDKHHTQFFVFARKEKFDVQKIDSNIKDRFRSVINSVESRAS